MFWSSYENVNLGVFFAFSWLKGIVERDFCLSFFSRMGFSQAPNSYLKAFRIWLWIRGNIRDFEWISVIIYSGELILPVFIDMESCDFSYRYHRGVTELQMYDFSAETLAYSLIWGVYTLRLIRESIYSPNRLIWRVTIPHILFSGGQCL